jgi:hypothetical protein
LCLFDRADAEISGEGHEEFTAHVIVVRGSARLLRDEAVQVQKNCVQVPECAMSLPMGNETAYSLAWVGHAL